jgi:hypothetical protein
MSRNTAIEEVNADFEQRAHRHKHHAFSIATGPKTGGLRDIRFPNTGLHPAFALLPFFDFSFI